MAEHSIVLDLKAGISPDRPRIEVRQGERGSEVIKAVILNDGMEVDLTEYSAVFNCITPAGTIISDGECEISGSTITYVISEWALTTPGLVNLAYFDLLKGGNYKDSTEGIIIQIDPGSTSKLPQDYFQSLDQALSQYYALIEAAKTQATMQAQQFAEAEAEREQTRHQTEVAGTEALQNAYFAKVLVDRAQESLLWPNTKADIGLAFWQIGHACHCVDWMYLYHRLYCHTDEAQYDEDAQRINLEGFVYNPETKRFVQQQQVSTDE